MDDILITATIGDQQTAVRISFPHGGAGIGHIYIDKWYHGQLKMTATGIEVYTNGKSDLCAEDIQVIKEVMLGHA